MADARGKRQDEGDVDCELEEDQQPIEDNDVVYSDEDDDEAEKPAWAGYFRLPRKDVELGTPFLPNDNLLPEHARPKKISQVADLYSGWWTPRTTTGETVGERKRVLIKPVGFLREREARILSIVAGTDELAERCNVTRFYGAVVYRPRAEYKVILEYCDAGFLRDHVLDTSVKIDAVDLSLQIANGMRYLHYGAPYHPIIHRNLNPLSILLKNGPGGRKIIKLHGFEHAKIMAPHETFGGRTVAPTNPGLWLGPELNLGETTRTESDVYSYAMVVWHIFSRKLPFGGKKMTDPQIMQLTMMEKKRPEMPPCTDCPKLWEELISQCWDTELESRPDFLKIKKAILHNDVNYLNPHKPLSATQLGEDEVKEKPADWELNPDPLPEEVGHILSSNKSSSTVLIVKYEADAKKTFVLKKPAKADISNFKVTKEQFADYMAVAKTIDSDYILKCNGVLLLESLQYPHMDISARQHLKGRRIKDKDNHTKRNPKGFGSMTPEKVHHTMKGVLEGLHYLHTATKICHGGLSTSNVLITKVKSKASTWKVRLCDYNLRALGLESHSHNLRYAPPAAKNVQHSPRGDLYSCGIMFVELYTGTDPTESGKWKKAREKVREFAKIWEAVRCCENCDDLGDLKAQEVLDIIK